MSNDSGWTPAQLQTARDLVGAMMQRSTSITALMIDKGARRLRVELSEVGFDATRENVDRALRDAGLGGIANFFASGGLAFDQVVK